MGIGSMPIPGHSACGLYLQVWCGDVLNRFASYDPRGTVIGNAKWEKMSVTPEWAVFKR